MKTVRLSLKSYDLVEIWLTWSEGGEVELLVELSISNCNSPSILENTTEPALDKNTMI